MPIRSSCTERRPSLGARRLLAIAIVAGSLMMWMGASDVARGQMLPGAHVDTQASGAKNLVAIKVDCRPGVLALFDAALCTVNVADLGGSSPRRTPTGSVSFTAPLGVISPHSCELRRINSSSAECTATYTAFSGTASTHTVTAEYGGSTTLDPGTESTEIRIAPPTTTTLDCQPDEVILSLETTCRATVTDSAPNSTGPAGTVTFHSSGPGSFSEPGPVCRLEAPTGNTASCSVSYLALAVVPNSHRISAVYADSTLTRPGSEGSQIIRIRNPTSTSLVCTPADVVVGGESSCVATVERVVGASSAPAGIVGFKTDDPAYAGRSLDCSLEPAGPGRASCEFIYVPNQLSTGVHRITANYLGDSQHESSSGSAEVSVSMRATATTVACSPGEIVAKTGESTCVATVEDAAGANPTTPGGEVIFESDDAAFAGHTVLCIPRPAGAGRAVCEFGYVPNQVGTGLHRITATYRGDATHLGSKGSDAIKVLPPPPAPTETTIVCSHGGTLVLEAGDAVSCGVRVTDPAVNGARIPRGSVKIESSDAGGVLLFNSCDEPEHIEGFVSRCSLLFQTSEVNPATTITARYQPDPGHAASSASATFEVKPFQGTVNPTQTKMSCSHPTDPEVGDTVFCGVVITDTAIDGPRVPFGSVKVASSDADGVFSFNSCDEREVISDRASRCLIAFEFSEVNLATTITAQYQPDRGHTASSDTATFEVKPFQGIVDPTQTEIFCPGLAFLEVGSTVACAVLVTDIAPAGATRPLGRVQLESSGAATDFSFSNCGEPQPHPLAAATTYCEFAVDPSEVSPALTITARYKGAFDHTPSSDSVTFEVRPAR
jgi:hypothetical protein